MKISIVVPVYNAEKYLQECIQSVLNQTNSNWELVLVDDGSIDKSGEICDAFAEAYPDKILSFHKQNQGQFLTRQYGIQKCSGEYIGFLDADDILAPEYTNEIIYYVERMKNPDVVCFGYTRFSDTRNKEYNLPIEEDYKTFEKSFERIEVYEHIINGSLTGSMWSKVFKKDCLIKVDINSKDVSNKRFAEDAYHSFSVMAEVDKILYLNKKLYFYRENLDGMSERIFERDLDHFNTKYVFELLQDCLSKWEMNTKKFEDVLYARNFNETVYYLLKYYRAAKSKSRRREIVEFDWKSYLLPEVLDNLAGNQNIRQSYLKVWRAFNRKAYFEIYLREKFKKYIGW